MHAELSSDSACGGGLGADVWHSSPQHGGNLPNLRHQVVELVGIKRLHSVGKSSVWLVMYFYHEAIGTDGNRGAWMLRRDEGGETEFLTLSMWESRDAIKAFAGEDIEAAVLYPEDEQYLLRGESSVTHYEIVDEA